MEAFAGRPFVGASLVGLAAFLADLAAELEDYLEVLVLAVQCLEAATLRTLSFL